MAHQANRLPQREAIERMRGEHDAANDRLGCRPNRCGGLGRSGVAVRVGDRGGAAARRPRPIVAARRGPPTPSSWGICSTNWKPCSAVRASLEDSLLEVMERREELQGQLAAELGTIETLQADLAERAAGPRCRTRRDRRGSSGSFVATRDAGCGTGIPICLPSTSDSAPGEDPAPGSCWGIAAAPAGSRSTSGELARISAAPEDDLVRCPECGAILLRVKGFGQ